MPNPDSNLDSVYWIKEWQRKYGHLHIDPKRMQAPLYLQDPANQPNILAAKMTLFIFDEAMFAVAAKNHMLVPDAPDYDRCEKAYERDKQEVEAILSKYGY
jgi:hypothetical protein